MYTLTTSDNEFIKEHLDLNILIGIAETAMQEFFDYEKNKERRV